MVAVVADGAGSVSGTSAWGSYAACQSVLHQTMAPAFLRSFRGASADDAAPIMRWLFEGALEAVRKQADALGVPLNQLATTLCVAVATPSLALFGQIGDGVIASESGSGIDTHLIEEKSEYANATWFVQSDGAFEESFRTMAREGLTAFALSTDGMTYKITNIVTGKPYEPFFAGSWQHVRSGASAADFAALLRGIEDDQTGDDKTMVLAALEWVNDEFHPSARPVQKTVVSSAPPPMLPTAAPRNGAVVTRARKPVPPPDSVSIVERGEFVDGQNPLPPSRDTTMPPADENAGDSQNEPISHDDDSRRNRRWQTRRRKAQQ